MINDKKKPEFSECEIGYEWTNSYVWSICDTSVFLVVSASR